eukprot:TRINITY_DN1890_c0_g1_i1.p1 TRINITY_DN1890_c0_g1~~TRINITY_DN1890_c0_g1_i1.p1  ORF type:complete len:142 (+),score=36.02 TRINITY_DN1890_c0_g1_i1:169-594(+)
MSIFFGTKNWDWIIQRSRESPRFFAAFAALCVAIPTAAAVSVQALTNPTSEAALRKQQEVLKHGRKDAAVMARVNKERLGQLLREVEKREDTEDRYRAALRGETLTGIPGHRVRGGGGTTLEPMTPPSAPTPAPAAPTASE